MEHGEAGKKARALFVCTHNSARSQMAEGLLRHLAGDDFEAFSAGTEATHVRALAVEAMREVGVDISGQESETHDRYLGEPFDFVVTVCDEANRRARSSPARSGGCTGRCPIRRRPRARRRSAWRSSGR